MDNKIKVAAPTVSWNFQSDKEYVVVYFDDDVKLPRIYNSYYDFDLQRAKDLCQYLNDGRKWEMFTILETKNIEVIPN